MTYIMLAIVEGLGLLILYATWRGIFGLGVASLFVLVMLATSFHILARDPRPDATSSRMACFAAGLWYGAILSGKLFLEFRTWPITLGAGLFCLLCAVIAGFATVSVLERPLDYDVEESE